MLIGVAGELRSGKDTLADILVQEHGFAKRSLALKIKEMVEVLTGIPLVAVEEYGRDTIIPWLGVSHRYLWQTIGTEWGRNIINKDIWLLCLNASKNNIVIPDIRFTNEADYIRKSGGKLIHVIRPDNEQAEGRGHESENGVSVSERDIVIYNDRTLEDYKQEARRCLKELLSQSSN